jgi:superfamily II DNA or RNA helicase
MDMLTDLLPTAFKAKYDKLTDNAITLLKLSAVAGMGLSRTSLITAGEKYLNISAAKIRAELEQLLAQDWYIEESSLLTLGFQLRRFIVGQVIKANEHRIIVFTLDGCIKRQNMDALRFVFLNKRSAENYQYEYRRLFLLGEDRHLQDLEEYYKKLGDLGQTWLMDLVLFCDEELMLQLGPNRIQIALKTILDYREEETPAIVQFIDWLVNHPKLFSPEYYPNSVLYFLLEMGHFESLDKFPITHKSMDQGWCVGRAVSRLVQGDFNSAIEFFQKGLQFMRAKHPRKIARYENSMGLLYVYTLLLRNQPGDILLVEEQLELPKKASEGSVVIALRALWLYILGNSNLAEAQMRKTRDLGHDTPTLNRCILVYIEWIIFKEKSKIWDYFENYFSIPSTQNDWWSQQIVLFKQFTTQSKVKYPPAPTIFWPLPQAKDLWENALERLEVLLSSNDTEKSTLIPQTSVSRLAWVISHNPTKSQIVAINPIEQRRNKSGEWSTGRNIALKHFKGGQLPDCATEQDRQAGKGIIATQSYRNYYGGGVDYSIDIEKMCPLLIDHPTLLSLETSLPYRLKEGQVSLTYKESPSGYTLQLHPELLENQKYAVVQQSAQDLVYYAPKPEQLKILEALPLKCEFPKQAKERFDRVLEKISGLIPVQGAQMDLGQNAESVEPDSRLILTLTSRRAGLFMHAKCCPLGLEGPSFIPGEGAEMVMGSQNEKIVKTQRSFKSEQHILQQWGQKSGLDTTLLVETGLQIDDPEQCLDILDTIRQLGENLLAVWPEGAAKRIRSFLRQDDLKLKFNQGRQWFEVQGKIELPDGLQMTLLELLEALKHRQGKYIPLADGDLLKLSDDLLKDLQVLSTIDPKNENMELHPLLAVQLQHLEGQGRGKKNAKWVEWKKRYEASFQLEVKKPAHFEGHLRSYQWEGVQWMLRMAHWGAGVCLADDMGLGKTIQALMVLSSRAKLGPALVVCPTSLVRNWCLEALRFTPNLHVVVYGEGERTEQIEQLKAQDILICTYGLLQKDIESFDKLNFATFVLDEAQAVKNSKTKRRQAVACIKAEFKVALSGTPVENDVQEIWSVFDILNPGLLGSEKFFEGRFDFADENHRKHAHQSLRALLSPFLLRRLKRDVLQELPAKTEVILDIELSPEERALYETLRLQAKEMVASAKGPQRRLAIFAELMKLRRACCHPSLVSPELNLNSSKLNFFTELAHSLKQGEHRALVFSQFVGHLHLIRDRLTEEGFSVQYLDGTTPQKQRGLAVEAFQNGEGDFFLISLKAGGTGLNLTAADYVIHMDPWWNPAVEDQASDRAHRIGQLRPVTVYRLITKDTIEERIIELHNQKRDLADAILEGQGQVNKLDLDELVGLLV